MDSEKPDSSCSDLRVHQRLPLTFWARPSCSWTAITRWFPTISRTADCVPQLDSVVFNERGVLVIFFTRNPMVGHCTCSEIRPFDLRDPAHDSQVQFSTVLHHMPSSFTPSYELGTFTLLLQLGVKKVFSAQILYSTTGTHETNDM